MVRGILFDMGGTLDGEGHWLDRFVALYRRGGVTLPRERLREAFDAAEARAAVDDVICGTGIEEMVRLHVGWQFEHLGLDSEPLRETLIAGFVEPIRRAAAANRSVLAELASRGLSLGIVSNGCGNVDVLCRDYGYAPFLTAVIDSRRLGVSKPDPRIFEHAARLLGVAPASTLVVGDSFERDIVPARRAGMLTAWFQPNPAVAAPDPLAIDLRLERIDALAASLLVPASHR